MESQKSPIKFFVGVLLICSLATWQWTADLTIASVTFTPAQVQLGEDRGFYVAANESNQIFVYFGDSRQLFAFQFTPPLTSLMTE